MVLEKPISPRLLRRLGSVLYENLLLFGVLFIADLIFSLLASQHSAMTHRFAGQLWLLCVLLAYYLWFWTHGGQTLAMKTWHITIYRQDGAVLSIGRALWRFVWGSMSLLPGLLAAHFTHANGIFLAIYPAANLVLWWATMFFNPERQFLHDRLAGTMLVDTRESQSENRQADKMATDY